MTLITKYSNSIEIRWIPSLSASVRGEMFSTVLLNELHANNASARLVAVLVTCT